MEKFIPTIHPTKIGKFSIERWNVVQATYVPMEEVEFGSFAEAKQYARECSEEYAKEMQEDELKQEKDDSLKEDDNK
jgi:hypothetical protein